MLTDHFVPLVARTLARAVPSLAPGVRERLIEYDWPGNVRQLQSVLKYAIIRASGDVLTIDCLPENLLQPGLGLQVGGGAVLLPDVAAWTGDLLRAGETDLYRQVSMEMDRTVLDAVLRHVKGNQVQASELLGISRTTLRAKLRALGVTTDTYLTAGPDAPGR